MDFEHCLWRLLTLCWCMTSVGSLDVRPLPWFIVESTFLDIIELTSWIIPSFNHGMIDSLEVSRIAGSLFTRIKIMYRGSELRSNINHAQNLGVICSGRYASVSRLDIDDRLIAAVRVMSATTVMNNEGWLSRMWVSPTLNIIRQSFMDRYRPIPESHSYYL